MNECQTWTLHSSSGEMANKLENKYGGCLTVDNNNVTMSKSNTCNNATKWIFTPQGYIKPLQDRDKCLSYNDKDFKLNLTKCSANTTDKQQWAFI